MIWTTIVEANERSGIALSRVASFQETWVVSSTSARLSASMPCPRIYSSGLYCVPYHKTASQAERGGTRGHLSLILIAFLPSSAGMGAAR